MRNSIAIAGSLAQRPGHGGHTWVFLQYLLGLRRLGWDVLFLDWLAKDMCRDEEGRPCPFDRSWNLRYFLNVFHQFGLSDCFSLDYNSGEHVVGLPRAEALKRLGRSALLLNVMGYLVDEELFAVAPRRVFLDIDPGFGQMWRELGLADLFREHDAYVTIGENIGQLDCQIPACGLSWITSPQPVVLQRWPAAERTSGRDFTSVVSWRGPFAPIKYQGQTYGLRVHEFRRFVSLPRLSGRRFRLALDIDSSDEWDLNSLKQNGWKLDNPRHAAGDPDTYRAYVQNSKAELMVAKNLYVRTKSGWLSDRSLCYLASGRPVLAQDTGFGRHYPTGEGLLAFSTLEQAVDGVENIERDYVRHARAARGIAEEFFDSDKVLTGLLAKLGIA